VVHSAHVPEEDKSVLRWGGLAGLVGGLLFVLLFLIVGVFVAGEPTTPDGPVGRFSGIDAAIVESAGNGLYLAILALWVPLSLALYRRLSRTRPAPALFGSALSILGLGILAAGALPNVATRGLSDRYHTPTATATDKAAIAYAWQSTQGALDAQLAVGVLLISAGVILLGLAIHGDLAFGKGLARMGVALGVAGLAAGTAEVVDPSSELPALGFFALIIFHLALGWKTYRMSRTGQESLKDHVR
jgi:hypothetical protein